MFRTLLLPLVLLGFVVFAGCPQSSLPEIDVPDIPDAAPGSPTEDLTKQLGSLAETGEMFPGAETIPDNIAAIKATDAAKGAALEQAYGELNAAWDNPDSVKAKAAAMLKML